MSVDETAASPLTTFNNRTLATRLLQVRVELYGERGGASLAGAIGLLPQTWENYEAGVAIPAPVLLAFIILTAAEPKWLMTGMGTRYRSDQGGCPVNPSE